VIQEVNIPVTVKCRLGVDNHDKWENLVDFIKTVSEQGGVNKFILHARKAFLKGLNPKENRNVPPLKYDWVLELKKLFPDLEIVINGGFLEIEAMHDILKPEN
jgi:tRNA-dihydrouridine synthase A